LQQPPYNNCPRCGFLCAATTPFCPRCHLELYRPPPSEKKRLWKQIQLYAITVPSLVIAAIPVAWIGTFLIDALLAGDKAETGGHLGESNEKLLMPMIMSGITAACAFLSFFYILRKPEVMRLWEGDLDAELAIPRWIAIELAIFVVIEFFAFRIWANS
jgi:hypothetical protein